MPGDHGTRVRIGDVARVAGVSAQTISNVMNDRAGFTEDTRRRVLAAVEATGYRPNRAAQNLRTRRARQIGFHLTNAQMDVRNPFSLTFLRALVHAANEVGYRVIVLAQADMSERSFRDEIEARDLDGFVLSDCDVEDYRTALMYELDVPFVVMGRTPPHLPQTWVDVDNRQAMDAVVDHLIERGHKHFAYVGYTGRQFWATERLEGARDRLASHGMSLPDSDVVLTTPGTVHTDVADLVKRLQRPTAVITGSDSLAVAVVNVAHARHLTVGVDVAVTGFDGCALETTVSPALTTVRIPLSTVADAVLARFVRLVEHTDSSGPGLILPTSLLLGGTT